MVGTRQSLLEKGKVIYNLVQPCVDITIKEKGEEEYLSYQGRKADSLINYKNVGDVKIDLEVAVLRMGLE